MCLTTLELDCWPTNQSLLSPNQLGQLRKSAFSFESIDGMVSNIQKNLYPFDLPPPIQFRAPYPIVLFTTVTIPLFLTTGSVNLRIVEPTEQTNIYLYLYM